MFQYCSYCCLVVLWTISILCVYNIFDTETVYFGNFSYGIYRFNRKIWDIFPLFRHEMPGKPVKLVNYRIFVSVS